jgi:hypothetical protein
MQDDVLPFGNDAPKFNTLAGILTRHAFKVGDKRILAVRNGGVVLRVGRTDKPCRPLRRDDTG